MTHALQIALDACHDGAGAVTIAALIGKAMAVLGDLDGGTSAGVPVLDPPDPPQHT